MPFFSKVFKHKDTAGAAGKSRNQAAPTNGHTVVPVKPKFTSTWTSKEIDPSEVEELIHVCTVEMKSRAEALNAPFLLLPFRPETDVGPARAFIRNFYTANHDGSHLYTGASLRKELNLSEPAVLCSILKWCWSRMPGGVVKWSTYEGFRMGEKDSLMSRTAFSTFIPMSVDSAARKSIIFDFYDLLAAIAAHSKLNGLGGRKLSRMAAWWAFAHSDHGNGFDDGYKSWATAADASSHLFFAYLRSLEPESLDGFTGINALPRSLQALVAQTEYPPQTPSLMHIKTPKVMMLVDSVSPGPFALLRRAKHFEYRDEELQAFSEYDDPIHALTEECKRVLNCIAVANQSNAARSRGGLNVSNQGLGGNKPDESWSRFQDFGFSDFSDETPRKSTTTRNPGGLSSAPRSRATNRGRPTTPSWADFLNSGFADDADQPAAATLLLPPDKILPPIGGTVPGTSEGLDGEDLEPGELASIKHFELDETFWWVWITSLASEEPSGRKGVFGRCALIETTISGGRWLVMEEQVKGASPVPEEGVYFVEKKSRFGFTRRGKANRRRSAAPQKSPEPQEVIPATSETPRNPSVSSKQQTMIKAAAAALAQQSREPSNENAQRRGRYDYAASTKTNSVLTLGLTGEAGPAMKWARDFDKEAIRKQYLGDNFAGKGEDNSMLGVGKEATPRSASPAPLPRELADRELPPIPPQQEAEQMPEVDTREQPRTLPVSKVQDVPAEPARYHETKEEAFPFPTVPDFLRPAVKAPVEQLPVASGSSASPKVTHVERKPVPVSARVNKMSDHPAFRNKSSEFNPAERAANQAWGVESRAFSPEPLKKSNQGGFRKLFGKKDKSFAPSPSTATLQPPSESSLGRKLSLLRRKTPSERSPTPLSMHSPDPAAEPTTPKGYAHQNSIDETNFSRVDTQDRADAEHAFSRFDQGPLTDAPAFAPRESMDSTDMPASLHGPVDPDHLDAPGAFPETPMNYATPAEESRIENDGASEASVPAFDRWAQIRKNAAERSARMSEDQNSRPAQSILTERTDDGETSGEETIEARVARIKARVAELTGNMEPPNSRVHY